MKVMICKCLTFHTFIHQRKEQKEEWIWNNRTMMVAEKMFGITRDAIDGDEKDERKLIMEKTTNKV